MNKEPKLLDGWKEIARHMNRSVRCVQRWETHEGLPVRRHGHTHGVSVYALTDELDAWWQDELRSLTESPVKESSIAVKTKNAAKGDTGRGGQTEIGLTVWEGAAILFFLRQLRREHGVARPAENPGKLEKARQP